MWTYDGRSRPEFAVEPGPGQESVWDYPRPPVAVPDARLVQVKTAHRTIAESTRTCRVLETASPPTFYIPPDDIDFAALRPAAGASFCEWKGMASYWALADAGVSAEAIGWCYSEPNESFASIASFLAFYPGRIACYVNGERVRPQPGHFYGGWLTDEIVGPVKGTTGTGSW